MSVWQRGSSIPDPKILAAAASDDPGCGKVFDFADCRLKHLHQKERERRGRRNEYEPCAYCEKIMKALAEAKPPIIENKVEENPEMEKELCSCGYPLSVNGKCHRCIGRKGGRPRKTAATSSGKTVLGEASKTTTVDMPGVGTAPEPGKTFTGMKQVNEEYFPEDQPVKRPDKTTLPEFRHVCPGCGKAMLDPLLCLDCVKKRREQGACNHMIGLIKSLSSPDLVMVVFADQEIVHHRQNIYLAGFESMSFCPLCGKKLIIKEKINHVVSKTTFEVIEI